MATYALRNWLTGVTPRLLSLAIPFALLAAAQTLLQQANRAREANRLDEAIPLYQQLVAAEPSNSEGWWYLGLCLYERDRPAEAAEAFARLNALHPEQGAGWAMQGLSEFRAQRYQDALATLRRAHALGVPPANGLAHAARYHLSLLLNQQGEFESAVAVLTGFLKDNAITPDVEQAAGIAALRLRALPAQVPDSLREPVLLAGKASVLAWQLRLREARPLAMQLVERYPRLPNAHYTLGLVLLRDNDRSAIDVFRRELVLDANHVPAHLQLAHELLQLGQAARALPHAERAAELDPNNFLAHDFRGRILLDLGRLPDAIASLEKAVSLAPNSPECHLHLASAYARAGRKEDADRHRAIFRQLRGGSMP